MPGRLNDSLEFAGRARLGPLRAATWGDLSYGRVLPRLKYHSANAITTITRMIHHQSATELAVGAGDLGGVCASAGMLEKNIAR
jgi:hypothetical protein